MDNLEPRKFYIGNILMCVDYNRDSLQESYDNSTIYIKNALLYKLSDGRYFYIHEVEGSSELISFISLVPEEAFQEKDGEKNPDLFDTKPMYPFDMYVDESSLRLYGITKNNDSNTTHKY